MSKPRFCCVPCCKNVKFSLVHKFPSDNERAEQWRQALAIDGFIGLPIELIRKRYYVCTRHFRDSDYKNKASRSINTTAVPSINLFALDNPEGLNRKIPSPVRIIVPEHCRGSGTAIPEQSAIEQMELDEQILREKQDAPAVDLLKHDEYMLSIVEPQPQQCEKSSITDALNNFMEENFTGDPNISVTNMTNEASVPGSSRVERKRTLLKRLHSTGSTITVPQSAIMLRGKSNMSAPIGRPTRFFSRNQPPSSQQPDTEPVVLKRVKISPFVRERKQKVTTSAMTQTDDLQSILDTVTKETPSDEGYFGSPTIAASSNSGSTKVLALLECTPENLTRLQQKLNVPSGTLCLDERLLLLDDNGKCTKGDDNVMSSSKAEDKSKFLKIRNAQTQETASVSYVWLRDHCRCVGCYNSTTNQRSCSILDLTLDVQPTSCNINNDRIDIIWNDGHLSSYDLNEIFANQLNFYRKLINERRSQLVLWDRALISETSGYVRVTLNDLLCEDEVLRKVVGSLVTYGVAFITKVPPNQQSTEIAVKRIFPIQRTLFGEMWTFSDDKMDHSDTAYTNDYLGPHTDNTYFNDAAGLQVLHCIQFNGTGAETILVDGYRATESLRSSYPDAFERLCEYPLEAEYIEEEKHHRYVAPVIKRHPYLNDADSNCVVEQIRFNPYDRAPLRTLSAATVPQFYADYQQLAREIHNEELQWKFQLTPGTVLIFDNWRILHGRMAYSGKRVMTGCYVARTEYQSVARTMGFIE